MWSGQIKKENSNCNMPHNWADLLSLICLSWQILTWMILGVSEKKDMSEACARFISWTQFGPLGLFGPLNAKQNLSLMVFVAEHLTILLSMRSSRVAWKNTRLEPANGPKSSKNRPAAKNKAVLRGPCQLAGFKMIDDPRGSKFPRWSKLGSEDSLLAKLTRAVTGLAARRL